MNALLKTLKTPLLINALVEVDAKTKEMPKAEVDAIIDELAGRSDVPLKLLIKIGSDAYGAALKDKESVFHSLADKATLEKNESNKVKDLYINHEIAYNYVGESGRNRASVVKIDSRDQATDAFIKHLGFAVAHDLAISNRYLLKACGILNEYSRMYTVYALDAYERRCEWYEHASNRKDPRVSALFQSHAWSNFTDKALDVFEKIMDASLPLQSEKLFSETCYTFIQRLREPTNGTLSAEQKDRLEKLAGKLDFVSQCDDISVRRSQIQKDINGLTFKKADLVQAFAEAVIAARNVANDMKQVMSSETVTGYEKSVAQDFERQASRVGRVLAQSATENEVTPVLIAAVKSDGLLTRLVLSAYALHAQDMGRVATFAQKLA